MSKTNKIYKIFMTTMIVAIAGMLLAMGIIAAQKTMKLGVRFPSNPNYRLEVWIEKYGGTAEPVFCNFKDDALGKKVEMKNGITSLDGNTIVADNSFFTNYENDFTIIIKNYTESTGIEVSMTSTATMLQGGNGIPAQIEAIDNTASKYEDSMGENPDSTSFRIYVNSVFPQSTELKITISEHSSYAVTFNNMVNCSANNTEVGVGEDFEINITPTVSYDAYYYDYTITINDEPYTHYGHCGTLIIPAEDITGDINVSVSAFECWDGETSETDYSPANYDSNNPFGINSPGDLAKMMFTVRNTTGRAYNNDIFDNITFELKNDIYLNDEDFIYEEDTGYVYITDGVNEGWLGTGAKGTTLYSWKNDSSYTGLLHEWDNCGNENWYFSGFTGIFDGNSYKVSGIYQNTKIGGLFGNVGAMYFDGDDDDIGYTGAVYNLGIINSVSGKGAFSGKFDGYMLNCFNEGIVLGESCGGLVGGFGNGVYYGTTVLNCYNSGYVIGSLYVGGISLEAYDTGMWNCINIGKVIQYGNNGFSVGGIFCGDGAYSSTFRYCYNLGSIEVETVQYCGGLFGRLYSSSNITENCYFIQTTTINAGLPIVSRYASSTGTTTTCGTIDSFDARIPSMTITSQEYTNITVLEALNKAVELSANSSYKTWQSINPPKFGNFWTA